VDGLWKSRAGDAKLEAYNCGGVAYYIAKMFPWEDTRYDISGLEYIGVMGLAGEGQPERNAQS
jgi:hypothetical protein